MSICNRLDLQTLGSQPIMPKNLPGQCFSSLCFASLDEKICYWVRIWHAHVTSCHVMEYLHAYGVIPPHFQAECVISSPMILGETRRL